MRTAIVLIVLAATRLYAQDKPGDELWTFSGKGKIEAPPVFENGLLYFTSGEGKVYCLKAQNGALVWEYENKDPIYASPAIDEGRLIVSSLRGVFSLDAASGKLDWSKTLGGNGYSAPVVVDGRVYVGHASREVYRIDAKTGRVDWTFTIDKGTPEIEGSPAVADGRVYVGWGDKYGNNGGVLALDATSGKLLWTHAQLKVRSPVAALRDQVIICGNTEGHDGYVKSLEAATGKVNWEHRIEHFAQGPATIDDERIFVARTTGGYSAGHGLAAQILCMRKDTRATLWARDFGGKRVSSAVVIDDQGFVGSDDGQVVCFDVRDGKILWSHETPRGTGDPIVVRDHLYVAAGPKMICLRAFEDRARTETAPQRWAMFAGRPAHLGACSIRADWEKVLSIPLRLSKEEEKEVEALKDHLTDDDPQVRSKSQQELLSKGAKIYRWALDQAGDDRADPEVRARVQELLKAIESQGGCACELMRSKADIDSAKLAALLESHSATLAEKANQRLKEITGKDLVFQADAPAKERAEAVRRWREFLKLK